MTIGRFICETLNVTYALISAAILLPEFNNFTREVITPTVFLVFSSVTRFIIHETIVTCIATTQLYYMHVTIY